MNGRNIAKFLAGAIAALQSNLRIQGIEDPEVQGIRESECQHVHRNKKFYLHEERLFFHTNAFIDCQFIFYEGGKLIFEDRCLFEDCYFEYN